MASNLRKIAVGGLAGTVGAGLAAYLFLKEDGDYRVGIIIHLWLANHKNGNSAVGISETGVKNHISRSFQID